MQPADAATTAGFIIGSMIAVTVVPPVNGNDAAVWTNMANLSPKLANCGGD